MCNYTADFTWQSTGGNNPTLTFQGSYAGQPVPSTWTWDFTNNGTSDDTGQTTTKHYTGNPSNVTAKLTIQGGTCAAISVTHLVIP